MPRWIMPWLIIRTILYVIVMTGVVMSSERIEKKMGKKVDFSIPIALLAYSIFEVLFVVSFISAIKRVKDKRKMKE